MLIAPSLLSADFSRLGEELQALEKAGADWIHLDIMDSHFVSELTFGPGIVQSLRHLSNLSFDVHLMVSHPENLIKAFANAGANHITFHLEASSKPRELIKNIQSFNLKAGLSIKPETPVNYLFPFLEELDLILIMTVEPGKGGQGFLKEQAHKIKVLKKKIKTLKNTPWIEVDGGINPTTAKHVKDADILVSGHYIMKSENYSLAISNLKASATSNST